jgi:sugar phosphate isomerase/epimerase
MHVGFRICGTPYAECLRLAKKLGFTDLEPEWSVKLSGEYAAMGRMARRMKIRLSAVLTGADPMSLTDFRKAFDDCAAIGATSFTAHPHPLKADDAGAQREFQDRFGAAAELGRKAGVKLAVHSCGLGPEQWDLMFRLAPALSLKYDPSFSAQAGRSYVSEIFKYAGRIVHVHAKDEMPLTRTTDYGSGIIPMAYAPAGMGQIQWGSVIAALYEGGYDGQIAIEPHSHYWCTVGFERGLVLAKRHLEQFLA